MAKPRFSNRNQQVGTKPPVMQQGAWADLGLDLQQALRQRWMPAQPLQVRCAVREQTLLVLVEHLLHVEPNPEETFESLEQTIRQVLADGQAMPTQPASLGVDQLPVQLFLRIAGYQQPYASRQLTVNLKPPVASPAPAASPPASPAVPEPSEDEAVSPAPAAEPIVQVEPVGVIEVQPPEAAEPVLIESAPPVVPEPVAEQAIAPSPEALPTAPRVMEATPEVIVPPTPEAIIPTPLSAEATAAAELVGDSVDDSGESSLATPVLEQPEVEQLEVEQPESAVVPENLPLEVAETPLLQTEQAAVEPVSADLFQNEPSETTWVEDPTPVEPRVIEPNSASLRSEDLSPAEESESGSELPVPLVQPVVEPVIEMPQARPEQQVAEPEAEPILETLPQPEFLETDSADEGIAERSLPTESLTPPTTAVDPVELEASPLEAAAVQPVEAIQEKPPETPPEIDIPVKAPEPLIAAHPIAAPPFEIVAEPVAEALLEAEPVPSIEPSGEIEPTSDQEYAERLPVTEEAALTQPVAEAPLEAQTSLINTEETPVDSIQPILDKPAVSLEGGTETVELQQSEENYNTVENHKVYKSETDFESEIDTEQNNFDQPNRQQFASDFLTAEETIDDVANDILELDRNPPLFLEETIEPIAAETTTEAAADLTPVLERDDRAEEPAALSEQANQTDHQTDHQTAIEADIATPDLSTWVAPTSAAETLVDPWISSDSEVEPAEQTDHPVTDAVKTVEPQPELPMIESLVEMPQTSETVPQAAPQAVPQAVPQTAPEPLPVSAAKADLPTEFNRNSATPESLARPLATAAFSSVDADQPPARRFRWSASTLTLAGAIGGFLIASGFYLFTRPCVLGGCEPLQRAERLGQEAIQTAQTTNSSLEVVEAYSKLNEASYLLGTIPVWSRYHSDAQALLNRYEDQSVVMGQVVKVLEQANTAAQRSQNPPHPLQEWREIQWQWREVISQLEKIPSNHTLYSLVQRKLTEYRANLTGINQRVAIEQQAQDRITAARQLEQAAEERAKAAKAPANWQETAVIWTRAIEQLRQIPQGTMPYDEAQQLLTIYQPRLAEANSKRVQEQSGADAYSQALNAAQQAEAMEQKNQWTQAASHWQDALSYAQQVPTNTSYYNQIQPLINTYTQALQQAQQNAQRAVALQTVRPSLDRVCGGSPQRCSYTLSPQSIRVQFTTLYDKTVAALITKTPTTDSGLPPAIVNQVNDLLRNLATVGDTTQTPIELYDSGGVKLGTYTPELSGYVPQ